MPMTPPPMTTRLSGMWSSVRQAVESMQAGHSRSPGMPGMMGFEPAAMIIFSGFRVLSPTRTVIGPVKLASPSSTVTLFARMRARTPPVSLSETL